MKNTTQPTASLSMAAPEAITEQSAQSLAEAVGASLAFEIANADFGELPGWTYSAAHHPTRDGAWCVHVLYDRTLEGFVHTS